MSPFRVRSLPFQVVGAFVASLACGTAFASSYTVLHRFTGGVDGANPTAAVTLDRSGYIYGMTAFGGDPLAQSGAIFKSDPSGKVTMLHGFQPSSSIIDGSRPVNNVLTVVKSTLYGGTTFGGSTQNGVLFSVQTDGTQYALLHDFSGHDGAQPIGALLPSRFASLTGITNAGGPGYVSTNSPGLGVLFLLSHTGVYHQLHTFNGADGQNPNVVLADAAGAIFGSTYAGGGTCNQHAGCGLIYKFDLSTRAFTVLYRFTGLADGSRPSLGSIGPDGSLYGAAYVGYRGTGSLFKLTPHGNAYQFSTLLSSAVAGPGSGPTLTPDGTLIDTANAALGSVTGGLFRYHGAQPLVDETFTGPATGFFPAGQPVIGPNAMIFGTTTAGGVTPCVDSTGRSISSQGCGVLYRYDPR